ncbi:hypothetical protein [Cupriavidus sp. D39]|uniref:hypothetical protein n=1 Tax=Cupriavidus sp. D39 TaxID=2997877 RepID=UPI00226F4BE5|nr:hypothetical protein [Cupriavidus sp. D39]MCY0852737.1 hypothetical protein [Cupriavidus sp. D39]MCY0854017.1 hypothetical protein [Cupriavidus sp. D39]
MAGKRKTVSLTPIVPSDAGADLNAFVPDLANWPTTWQIEAPDIAAGQRIIELLTPFLMDLLTQSITDKTRRRHRDHLWMLGGEIIRRRHEDSDLASLATETLLLQMIDDEGGPLIWPRITETEQKAFDTTSRKLYRYLMRVQEP